MVGVIRAAGAVVVVVFLAACSVIPAGDTRTGTPLFPTPESWPPRDPSAARVRPEELPPGVFDRGPLGAGWLYELDIDTDPAVASEAHMLIFRSSGPELSSVGGGRLTWEKGAWDIPPASTNLMVSVVARNDVPRAGTCVYLASLMGLTSHEGPIVHELLMHGWRVAVVWPSFESYGPAFYMLPDGLDSDRAADTLARSVDSYLAGTAYGVEAVLRWVQQHHPDARELPVALVGSSLGAIATPTAAARLRSHGVSRVDAAVLIGGGSNLMSISATSPVMRDRFAIFGMVPANDGSDAMTVRIPDEREVHALLERAHQRTRLDPASTAASLRDIPVLQLHARFDQIVPASAGDDLYERLGRPERWTYATGHTGLFLLLPFEADDIARWITATTRVPRAPSALP